MPSVWAQASLPRFASLDGDIKTGVLIIGGGMAGLLCAHTLARAGIEYVLLEADRLCGGVTQNTTAKVTSQHGLIYAKLLRRFGVERAQMYLRANEEAVGSYRALCQSMDCGFEDKDAFTYARTDRGRIDHELAALSKLGFPASFAKDLPLPFPVAGAVKFTGQAQFHPLRFAAAIAEGLHIFERTPVRELAERTALTDYGRVRADRIIVATHFPILNKHGSYFLKLYQDRSYVLALANAPDAGGMYVDEASGGLSFRSADGLLLLGGGAHRTGKRGNAWATLADFAARRYPEAREVCRWATQDCMSLDDVPYIGPYSASTPNLYVAAGFNKWGMTGSMVAATLLADMIQDRDNPYAPVFSPSRTMLRPQLALNVLESAGSLLTPTPKRCPHMGCALKWNPLEHSWDCPCHGSRFTADGRLINNPATGDLKKAR